jgi:predicted enzyme related to lactoylglutathione lyase
MHRNPLAWFEIHVADMQRAKVFDEAVLNYLNHLKKQKRIS